MYSGRLSEVISSVWRNLDGTIHLDTPPPPQPTLSIPRPLISPLLPPPNVLPFSVVFPPSSVLSSHAVIFNLSLSTPSYLPLSALRYLPFSSLRHLSLSSPTPISSTPTVVMFFHLLQTCHLPPRPNIFQFRHLSIFIPSFFHPTPSSFPHQRLSIPTQSSYHSTASSFYSPFSVPLHHLSTPTASFLHFTPLSFHSRFVFFLFPLHHFPIPAPSSFHSHSGLFTFPLRPHPISTSSPIPFPLRHLSIPSSSSYHSHSVIFLFSIRYLPFPIRYLSIPGSSSFHFHSVVFYSHSFILLFSFRHLSSSLSFHFCSVDKHCEPEFLNFCVAQDRFQGTNSASPCSLAL